MTMDIQIEHVLLALSVLFFLSIVSGKISSKFGLPALLLFLCVGMICGSDGLGLQFNNPSTAQTIGTVSLCIILFSSGLDTRFNDIRPVLAPGTLLATVGVLLTTAISGVLIWLLLGKTYESAKIGLTSSLLLAATMSSTDSASVFSILRSSGLKIKDNLRSMLELESGSNDPMAYVLVITLLAIVQTDGSPDYVTAIVQLVLQLVIGVAAGLGLGKLSLYLINKLKIDNSSLYPILVLTFSIFIFSFTYFIKGNGYLAVYIGGLVVGNHNFAHKRSSVRFFDGLAWLCQLIMFLTLGLLVNPHELVPVFGSGLIISVMMIFVARPASIFLCLIPFKDITFKEKLFVSWCGLRGAVPIIFAILPLSANVEHSHLFFNIVFFCTLISLLVQGTSLPLMARLLKLDIKGSDENVLKNFDVDFSDEIKSVTSEISLTEKALENGRLLMDLALPDKTLVVMIKRNNKFFVPTGKTELLADDKLLIITDDHTALRETYKSLGL